MRNLRSWQVCRVIAMIVAMVGVKSAIARAQGGDLFDQWDQAVAAMQSPVWQGPRVAWPLPQVRPQRTLSRLSSLRYPLAVHAWEPSISASRLVHALGYLEQTYADLQAWGWGHVWPDNGPRDSSFDMYLKSSSNGLSAMTSAQVATALAWPYYDTVSVYAQVSVPNQRQRLAGCVSQAYAESLLLALDPAESLSWRKATATWLSHRFTGQWGCRPEAIDDAQTFPWRSPLSSMHDQGAGGALWWQALALRWADADPVQEIWQLARQRTWDAKALRASPHLWLATAKWLELHQSSVKEQAERYAVMRFSQLAQLGLHAPQQRPTLSWKVAYPSRMQQSPVMPELEVYGSAYAMIDNLPQREGTRLRLWLRGEYGVRWSMVALVMRGDIVLRELHAPTRSHASAYIPIELEADATHVVTVVTNLSHRLPNENASDDNTRAFYLIVASG